jgi:hypothetical protein
MPVTTSNPGDYQVLLWLKIQVLGELRSSERLFLIDHYLTYCQTHSLYLTRQMEQLERDATQQQVLRPAQLAAMLYAMERCRQQGLLKAELVRAWCQRAVRQAEGDESEETCQRPSRGIKQVALYLFHSESTAK